MGLTLQRIPPPERPHHKPGKPQKMQGLKGETHHETKGYPHIWKIKGRKTGNSFGGAGNSCRKYRKYTGNTRRKYRKYRKFMPETAGTRSYFRRTRAQEAGNRAQEAIQAKYGEMAWKCKYGACAAHVPSAQCNVPSAQCTGAAHVPSAQYAQAPVPNMHRRSAQCAMHNMARRMCPGPVPNAQCTIWPGACAQAQCPVHNMHNMARASRACARPQATRASRACARPQAMRVPSAQCTSRRACAQAQCQMPNALWTVHNMARASRPVPSARAAAAHVPRPQAAHVPRAQCTSRRRARAQAPCPMHNAQHMIWPARAAQCTSRRRACARPPLRRPGPAQARPGATWPVQAPRGPPHAQARQAPHPMARGAPPGGPMARTGPPAGPMARTGPPGAPRAYKPIRRRPAGPAPHPAPHGPAPQWPTAPHPAMAPC